MLRLPAFVVVSPETVDGAVMALARPGARVLAGGTDLLPNLKHRLDLPPVLVSLSRVRGLDHVTVDRAAGLLRIGAGVRLSTLSAHPEVTARFPSLAHAAGIVASPLLRNMGTIGGNVHLDTRCRYVNQTEFWRGAIGGCLKSGGTVCHVVPGGQSCVAAMSSDCVPVLTTLEARVALSGPAGEREVAIADYYDTDGISHVKKDPQELCTEVRVPLPAGPWRTGYRKWTVRGSIDFPLVSIALRFDLDGDTVRARIRRAVVCLGVLAARPKLLRTDPLKGRPLADPDVRRLLGEICEKQGKPLDNVPYEAAYRRKVLPVHARRALDDLLVAG
ncbi:MAG TPA: FAD binding domain-containing protein [Kofleriaceae bacterium]|nr:FAD binding domain-containing protein [Kofleriaceae bacterium]